MVFLSINTIIVVFTMLISIVSLVLTPVISILTLPITTNNYKFPKAKSVRPQPWR